MSRTGRLRLAARYHWLTMVDRLVHNVLGRPWNDHGGTGLWPCFERDDVELERMHHDRDWCERRHPDVAEMIHG